MTWQGRWIQLLGTDGDPFVCPYEGCNHTWFLKEAAGRLLDGQFVTFVRCPKEHASYYFREEDKVSEEYLRNPIFDGGWHNQGGVGELYIPDLWTLAWWTKEKGQVPDYVAPFEDSQLPYIARPEVAMLSKSKPNEARLVLHAKAVKGFLRFHSHVSVLWQRTEVVQGAQLEASAIWQAWCSKKDNVNISEGALNAAIGIGTEGGTNPWSDKIIWSDWQWGQPEWRELKVQAIAKKSHVTVFLKFWGKWASDSHSDWYLGETSLHLVGEQPGPGPEPPTPPSPVDCLALRAAQMLLDARIAGLDAQLNALRVYREQLDSVE